MGYRQSKCRAKYDRLDVEYSAGCRVRTQDVGAEERQSDKRVRLRAKG
jgi:hypothetical protein